MLTQSKRLQELRDQEYFEDFRTHGASKKSFIIFMKIKAKSERIKTFPFPRQYASIALWLTLFFRRINSFWNYGCIYGQNLANNTSIHSYHLGCST